VTGEAFMSKWRGKSVGDLYTYTRTNMPTGAGGSLPDAQYLAVVAYMLSENGAPAGGTPLDPDEAILGSLGIE
jgi:hypothetical protein